MMQDAGKKSILLIVTLVAIAVSAMVEPIPQPLAYHLFADRRSWFSIPNSLDVLSNVPFAFIGVAGLVLCAKNRFAGLLPPLACTFIGVLLTAFGSAYYHWQPDNQSLVWDRLPMTLAFMGFFTFVLADRIDQSFRLLLIPLLLVGVFSVSYWAWSEARGAGDLRLYGLVQFLPMLLIPLILLMFRPGCRALKYYGGLMAGYALAKLFEHFDTQLYGLLGLVSGHTLKHLSAAAGAYFIYLLLKDYLRQHQAGE